MAKVTGLVIRPLFGQYVVCDGAGTDPDRNIYEVGTQFSPLFDTWEEADEWRRKIYDVISGELQEAANEFDNKDYEAGYKPEDVVLNIKKFFDERPDLSEEERLTIFYAILNDMTKFILENKLKEDK